MLKPCLTGQVASKIGSRLTVTIKGQKYTIELTKANFKVGEQVCIQFDWGKGTVVGLSRFDGDIYQVEEISPPEEFNEPLFDVPDQEFLAYRSFSGTEVCGDLETGIQEIRESRYFSGTEE
jgi:hypothetical protein